MKPGQRAPSLHAPSSQRRLQTASPGLQFQHLSQVSTALCRPWLAGASSFVKLAGTFLAGPGLAGLHSYRPQFILGNSPASVIVLANNRFLGCVPASFGSMSRTLNEIILFNNGLRCCFPPEIGLLKNLTILDLSFNQLVGPLPDSIGGMLSLEQLGVAHDRFLLLPGLPLARGESFPPKALSSKFTPVTFSLSSPFTHKRD